MYGGIPFDESRRVILQDKPHILIGTPGRICHLLEMSVLRLNKLKRFIIDECDNMLDQVDMRKQVQEIFKKTPHSKQVMMYSATIGQESRVICRKFTKNAKEIFVDDKQLTLHGLQQHYIKLNEREKNRKLNDLLDALDFNQVIFSFFIIFHFHFSLFSIFSLFSVSSFFSFFSFFIFLIFSFFIIFSFSIIFQYFPFFSFFSFFIIF